MFKAFGYIITGGTGRITAREKKDKEKTEERGKKEKQHQK